MMMQMLLGAGGVGKRVELPAAISSASQNFMDDSSASITIANTGGWTAVNGGAGTWRLAGASSDYDVRLNQTGGSGASGSAVNTWLNLGTTRSWSCATTYPPGGVSSSSGTIEIRDASTLTVLASCTYDIFAESFF